MDFLRSYFFENEPLISWTFFSSKLDSLVIKTLETQSLNVKKVCLYVLITGESNFDEKSVQLPRVSFIRKYLTSYKICGIECSGPQFLCSEKLRNY